DVAAVVPGARRLVALAALGHLPLVKCLVVFLVLVEVDQTVLVDVPLVLLELKRLRHLVEAQEAVLVPVGPAEGVLGAAGQVGLAHGTVAPAAASASPGGAAPVTGTPRGRPRGGWCRR